jgi:uroporphyrinogen decarboxylase
MKLNAGRLAILGGVSGPYTQAWILTGLDTFGINLYDDPQFIEDILDIVTEFNIELGLMMLDMGVDAIIIADDFGMDTGPLISPRHFREMILPRFNKMVKIFKERGVPVLLHCCGNINLLIADIVESGIDGYHPLQRTAQMDLKECKEKYGERISLVGNVDSSRTLPFGTYEDVEEETRECIRIAGPGGGYICASDHSLHDGIPMRNIWAMIETVKKYGHYPLS